MIMPVGASSFAEAIRCGTEIFHALRVQLHDAGLNINVGDEGGFAPNLASAVEALDFIMKAIEVAGYSAGKDVMLALDAASSEFYDNGKYVMAGEGQTFNSEEMAGYYTELIEGYPIVSIEDGMDEDDWDGWAVLTKAIGDRIQLVGDDLFVTNLKRLARGIAEGVANSILI